MKATLFNTFKAKISDRPDMALFLEVVGNLETALGNVRSVKADEQRNPDLSDAGRAKQVAARLADTKTRFQADMRRVRQARDSISVRRAEIANKVNAPDERGPDAAQRAEIRTFLRGLSEAERTQLITEGDGTFYKAARELPPQVSGLSDAQMSRAQTFRLEKTYGKEIGEIEAVEEALQACEMAVDHFRGVVRREAAIEMGE
jgi:hypothetical protein